MLIREGQLLMCNHDKMFPAMQKYYSALKALDTFGATGNFFDDVAHLDTFFSEFRNITFVLQKGLEKQEKLETYHVLREKYLSGDTLKWFVDTRNKTTKEKPFQLKKSLHIVLYLPYGTYTLQDKRLVVDFDSSFSELVDLLREAYVGKLEMAEVSFSAEVIFSEQGDKVDLYPKLIKGITQMNDFLRELQKTFLCECSLCKAIEPQIENMYQRVVMKPMKFINDYALGKELITGENVELYVSVNDETWQSISDVRASLDNPIFEGTQDCLVSLFKRFITIHVMFFQMQKHDIMPVFMVVYSDHTSRMIPIVATVKATIYRKALQIAELQDFSDAVAVFFCNEYYAYDNEQYSEIYHMPHAERVTYANKELLSFVLIARDGGEMTVNFDESKIDDMNYIAEELRNANWDSDNEKSIHGHLKPIISKFSDLRGNRTC